MDYYGSPKKLGFFLSTGDGLVSIHQEADQEHVSIALETDEAEQLIKELRRFLDDVASGKVNLFSEEAKG